MYFVPIIGETMYKQCVYEYIRKLYIIKTTTNKG